MTFFSLSLFTTRYHFHSGKQMALVAQICPNIAQVTHLAINLYHNLFLNFVWHRSVSSTTVNYSVSCKYLLFLQTWPTWGEKEGLYSSYCCCFLQMLLLLLFVSFLSSYCCCDNDESLPPRLNGGDYNKDPLRPLIENIGGMIMMAIPLGSS